ncbi:MAG: PQQ-binding-like beta-propeller repeat protein [Candidatus Sumerlaeota bacterium]|nr:PQQ-binding-like beta-propeller repeat protein [Candidatus Sumerlaeota bacterium]
MFERWIRRSIAGAVCGLTITIFAYAHDWPQWGGANSRTMVSDEKDIPSDFYPGNKLPDGSFDLSTSKNIKWIAQLGTESYGNPTVSGGKVFVGTNNAFPRNPKYKGQRGVVYCFEEATGKLLWQLAVPLLDSKPPHNMNGASLGICSAPTVEGNRAYVVTNRCEVLCLDVNGMADGNDGPFKDEGFYFAPPREQILNPEIEVKGGAAYVKPGTKPLFIVKPAAEPVPLEPTDADIIWRYDMQNELAIWPQDVSNCSVLIYGDLLFTSTSNGVDKSHKNVASPFAPTLIALDKKTGKLVAMDDANLGQRILHGTWSAPTVARVEGRDLILFGGPDGVCYAFDPKPAPGGKDGAGVLKRVWWYDCNPARARFKTRADARYRQTGGPSEIVATPVLYKDRVYCCIGEDPTHGVGPGLYSCFKAGGAGDITDKAKVWEFAGINRGYSTACIAEGLLFVGDTSGMIYCLDADTGRLYWKQDAGGEIWGSAYYADGKVFIGAKNGLLWIFAAGKEMKILSKVNLYSPILSTPIVANGVLYVATGRRLFAIQEKK